MKKNIFKLAGAMCLGVILITPACKSSGCTDELAENFDSDVELDDGSCEFKGDVIIYSDEARTLELYDQGVNAEVSVSVNDSVIGKLNYYNHLKSDPNCDTDYSNSTYESPIVYTHTMGSTSENISIRIEDSNGDRVSSSSVKIEVGECATMRI